MRREEKDVLQPSTALSQAATGVRPTETREHYGRRLSRSTVLEEECEWKRDLRNCTILKRNHLEDVDGWSLVGAVHDCAGLEVDRSTGIRGRDPMVQSVQKTGEMPQLRSVGEILSQKRELDGDGIVDDETK